MIFLTKEAFFDDLSTRKRLAEFILQGRPLSSGEYVRRFEAAFSKKQQRKFSVLFNSGSSANLALIQSLLNLGKIGKDSRGGVSALTWATNVMPLMQLGIRPVPIDISLDTLNVSLRKIKDHDIDFMFITNALGFCDNLKEIQDFCAAKNILLIEDNCESLGTKYDGRLLGNFSLATTFSFYVGHHISTIEGGIVCTDDEELYEMLLSVRSHGWTRDSRKNKPENMQNKDSFYEKFTFYNLGYNCRANEITGFLGCDQILHWDETVSKRHKNFNLFHKFLIHSKKCYPLNVSHLYPISNFAFPLVFKKLEDAVAAREKFQQREIEIRPIIGGNIEKQPFYKKIYRNETCMHATMVHNYGLYFPDNEHLNENELKEIIKILDEVV